VGGAEVALAVVSVVEMPGLSWLNELAAARAGDLSCGDEWLVANVLRAACSHGSSDWRGRRTYLGGRRSRASTAEERPELAHRSIGSG
jgi:hypothetical protein